MDKSHQQDPSLQDLSATPKYFIFNPPFRLCEPAQTKTRHLMAEDEYAPTMVAQDFQTYQYDVSPPSTPARYA
ncbi:MAG: hypothetical protein EBY17_30435 [Acidobacteriia bacterium]|nr:hypothetical protein [Terriglobia bacterium]